MLITSRCLMEWWMISFTHQILIEQICTTRCSRAEEASLCKIDRWWQSPTTEHSHWATWWACICVVNPPNESMTRVQLSERKQLAKITQPRTMLPSNNHLHPPLTLFSASSSPVLPKKEATAAIMKSVGIPLLLFPEDPSIITHPRPMHELCTN